MKETPDMRQCEALLQCEVKERAHERTRVSVSDVHHVCTRMPRSPVREARPPTHPIAGEGINLGAVGPPQWPYARGASRTALGWRGGA